MKHESSRVYEKLKFLKYKASQIPSGGLEVPLSFKIDCQEKWVTDVMEECLDNFCLYDFRRHEVDCDTIDISLKKIQVTKVSKTKVETRTTAKISD